MARKKADSGSTIRKRTPLEQAIAEQTNPRARYDRRMADAGYHRTTIWVRKDRLDEVKAFIKKVNADPQEPTQ